MEEKRVGRQTATRSVVLPYKKSHGSEALDLYNRSGRKALPWQELMTEDIMAVGEDGLWIHMKFAWSIIFTCRIRQAPIIVKRSADERTAYIAAHRDRNIRRGNIADELAVLCLLHVDAVELLHKTDCILVDLRFCFRSCRIALKNISCKVLAECFCDLAAT
jgi:hypothetical protein